MKEAFEIRGLWYMTIDQPKKTYGTLAYDPENGMVLTLAGAVHTGGSGFGDFTSTPDKADIILGETPNGGKVTLHKCFATHQNFDNHTGTLTSIWRVNEAFLGIQKISPHELVFTKCIAEISNLFEWLNQSGLAKKKLYDLRSPLDIYFEKPATIHFVIDERVNGQLQFTYSYSAATSYSSNINFKHGVEVVIETLDSKELSFNELLSYLKKIIHWLTISTGHPCRLEKLSLSHSNLFYESEHRGRVYVPIDTYLRISDAPFTDPFDPAKFNFTYPQLGPQMPELFTKWFALYPKLDIIIQILAENIARTNSFSEFHFKDIIQALESYHRKTLNNERMPKTNYKLMCAEILAQIDNRDYREFIKEKLNFGNEPTLANRLYELINNSGIKALLRLIGNQEEFVKIVKDNRNYLTHYDDSLKRKALSATDLYWLSEKALALLFVVVLSEVIPEVDFWEKWLPASSRWSYMIE